MERRADLLLRIGLAFALAYPAVNALFDPYSWLGYFPGFMHGYVPDVVLLHGFGALEIVLAAWLISGWRVFWPALAALALLIAIVILDFSEFQVLFRDISIAAIAGALCLIHWPTRKTV